MSSISATKKRNPNLKSAANSDKEKTHRLSLKGSAKLVTEFFEYAVNSILFQRGVYPAEDFTAIKKYGLNMLVSADEDVKRYIRQIISQLGKWMLAGKISKLVVVITSKETGENLERWQFDVQLLGKAASLKRDAQAQASGNNGDENATEYPQRAKEKTEKEIQEEIQSLFRQITASVTFLPMLDGRCTFNVLVYADGDTEVPMEWGDSDAREIHGGEKVALRSWGTSNHKVDTLVSYRLAE